MIMSLPSLNGTVFFISMCFNMVSFRGPIGSFRGLI